MNILNKIAKLNYLNGQNNQEIDLKFISYWQALLNLIQSQNEYSEGLRASIRRYIENNYDKFDKDIDFEDERLDIFYERPIFNDLRVENDKDVYYYQDYNTNRPTRSDNDYVQSIRNFQKILEESDLITIYMSIFKIYDYIMNKQDAEYGPREVRLMEAAIYILESAFNNLFA